MNNSKLESLLRLDKTGIPADGGTAFNRLIFARSPYLLQHAENPVDWREWDEEAFKEAKERDLPLFISVGYATCHWCHIMAGESFSDPEVATLLNESFIPVKVDREERPDIDEFYMTAARVLTGGGGWPLNIFIDHERRPFFSITYLPKLPRHRAPGLMDLLRNMATLWQEKRELLTGNSAEICRSIAALSLPVATSEKPLDSLTNEACSHLQKIFDGEYGGFGSAVKFPMPTYLLFLLSIDEKENPEARPMAFKSLDGIMQGGIHDQLGGGFHRYAVDQRWIIPHFEKMLYDQALLIITYAKAFSISKDSKYLETALKTASFACDELLLPSGGFAAGLDADSEGEEGLFYTWSYAELQSLLGNDAEIMLEYWGADREEGLDGRRILHLPVAAEMFAAKKNIDPVDLNEMIATASRKLLLARVQRERPLRDQKVIASWNSLMITALVRLSKVSGNMLWLEQAEKTALFILENMVNPDGRLLRNWLETPSTIPAFAEDYAAFTAALHALAACNRNPLWTDKMEFFGAELARLFVNATGEVAFCGIDAEKMPLDIPPVQDGVLPSTAALTAVAFIRMGRISGKAVWSEQGRLIIERYRGVTEKNPAACLSLLMTEEELTGGIKALL